MFASAVPVLKTPPFMKVGSSGGMVGVDASGGMVGVDASGGAVDGGVVSPGWRSSANYTYQKML